MSTFVEAQHPREPGGRFRTAARDEPEVTLESGTTFGQNVAQVRQALAQGAGQRVSGVADSEIGLQIAAVDRELVDARALVDRLLTQRRGLRQLQAEEEARRREAAERRSAYRGPGYVADRVWVTVGGEKVQMHRLRPEVWPDTPSLLRVQVDRELDAAGARHLASLVGYAYSATGGERVAGFFQDTPCSVTVHADTTKNGAHMRLERFTGQVGQTVTEGSPVRATDRSGPGTRGTRLVEGLGAGRVEVYVDSAFGPDVHEDPVVRRRLPDPDISEILDPL